MSQKRGFTLIELLVVIAIIGILASVVLASLNSARGRGSDAKVKSQIAAMRDAAELFYNGAGAGSYGTANATPDTCSGTAGGAGAIWADTDSGMARLVAASAYPDATAPKCNNTTSAWAAWHVLEGGTSWWCADSKGQSLSLGTEPASGATACQ